MYQIKTLTAEDFEFAVNLTNSMDWNMAIEDFQFMASLEPQGMFLLLEDNKPTGIATANSYGTKGWFGNLIVEKTDRNKGAGTKLLQYAINYLKSKGVTSIGLYAYPHLTDFYGTQGFKKDVDFLLLQTKNIPKTTAQPLPKITPNDFPRIMDFDQKYFEGNRTKLLKSIIDTKGNACYYIPEKNHVVGYITATIYDKQAWLGPLVCQPQRQDVALKLIEAVLATIEGKTAYAVVSKTDEELLTGFLEFGFKEEFFVSRMFLGEAFAKNCVYTAESLERG